MFFNSLCRIELTSISRRFLLSSNEFRVCLSSRDSSILSVYKREWSSGNGKFSITNLSENQDSDRNLSEGDVSD